MESHRQFIPAQPGWLALFEEAGEDGVAIHAEPVVAWSLEASDDSAAHHAVSFGQAVIGAGPWIDKADHEKTARFFALVREEQLEDDFAHELAEKSRHSRAELMARAEENHEARKQGHAAWVHDRRSHRGERKSVSPTKLF